MSQGMYVSHFYPHMLIGKVGIYRLLFVCNFVCMFVRLRIYLPRIKLAVSNFARWFISVLGRLSHILGDFAPTEAHNQTNRPARGPRVCPVHWLIRSAVHLPHVGSACRSQRWTYLLRNTLQRRPWAKELFSTV